MLATDPRPCAELGVTKPLHLLLAVSSFASVAYSAPKPLAAGKTFEGSEGDTTGTWRIVEGAVSGESFATTVPRNEFITTKKTFAKFEFRMKCKLAGTEGFVNGGIQFRSKRIANPPNEMSGYQADIGGVLSDAVILQGVWDDHFAGVGVVRCICQGVPTQ